MSELELAHSIMGIQPTNQLILLDKVLVGSKGTNYLFKLSNPDLKQYVAYEFKFNINRLKAQRVSYTDDGNGEFALFGKYKNTTRKVVEGSFKYRLYKDNISLVLKIYLTDKVDMEFLEKATFEFIIKGLEQSEELMFLGSTQTTNPQVNKL